MLSKIPFISEERKKSNLNRLCRYYFKDVLSNLAHSINVPESFFVFDARSRNRCRKEKINGTIVIDIAFTSSTDTMFDDLYLDIGQPESWYDDIISPQFNDTSSDFWKGYLLKTTKKIEKLDGLDSALKWWASI